jgi:hypothetical protein
MAIDPCTSGRLSVLDGNRQPRADVVGISEFIDFKFEQSKTQQL